MALRRPKLAGISDLAWRSRTRNSDGANLRERRAYPTTCIPLNLTPAPSKGGGKKGGGKKGGGRKGGGRNVRELTDEEEEPLDRDLRTNGNGKGKDNSQSPVSSYRILSLSLTGSSERHFVAR
jgi:hypothetical protein